MMSETTKIDLKKEYKTLYQPSKKQVEQVDVPAFNYLMIDGIGDPNTSQIYQEAIEALFAVSYAVKFMIKKGELAIDYAVMPLEGLWWAEDMTAFTADNKSQWQWTMMIMQPKWVSQKIVDQAIAQVQQKKGLPALAQLRFESFHEGRCAQIMHVGPFSEEGPTVQRVHEFIEARTALSGKHHEIYLSDIRRADPSKWKTIIRQPMQ